MDPPTPEEHGETRLMYFFPVKERLKDSFSLSVEKDFDQENIEDLVKVRTEKERETSNLPVLISQNPFSVFAAHLGFIGRRRRNQEGRAEYRGERNTLVFFKDNANQDLSTVTIENSIRCRKI